MAKAKYATDKDKNKVYMISHTKAIYDSNGQVLEDRLQGMATESSDYTDTKIAALVNGAPETLDTLKEVANAIENNETVVDALNSAIGTKANKTDVDTALSDKLDVNGDASDTTVDFTEASTRANIVTGEKQSTLLGKIKKWFADLKTVAFSGSYNDLNDKPIIPSKTSDLTNDSGFKTTDSNTTYSLSKSGSTITLTGSDGSTTSVTDSDTNTHYTSKNVVGSSTATSNTTTALTNGNVYLNSVENGSVTSAHKISGSGATTVTTDTSGNIVISSTDTNTVYTHPSYTARTGVPTANQTPAFGGTFSVSQPVSNSTGHITAVNSRTITIPSAVATASAKGLMSSSDKAKLNGIASGANKTVVDTTLSSTSTNPVQNKTVTNMFDTICNGIAVAVDAKTITPTQYTNGNTAVIGTDLGSRVYKITNSSSSVTVTVIQDIDFNYYLSGSIPPGKTALIRLYLNLDENDQSGTVIMTW